jgi:phage terminase large subunit-like protein
LAGEAMAALLPTLSARPNPQIWYASSAGMETSEQLLRVHQRALDGDSARLAYFEWSADPVLPLDDHEAWAQANPALGIRIDEEFICSEREALPDYEFSRERLGYWPSTELNRVISGEVWAKLVDGMSQVTDPVVFALAATPERSRGSIGVGGARSDGLLHGEVIENREGTQWMLPRMIELNGSHKPRAVVLDPASAAGSLIPGLQEAGIEPVLVTGRVRAQACGAFYDAVVETGTFRHRGQAPLNAALAGAKKKDMGDAWVFDRKASAVDVSPLDAVVLALHGHATLQREVIPWVAWV